MTPLEALKAANAAAECDALDRDWDDVQVDWEAVALAKLRELGWVIVPVNPTEEMAMEGIIAVVENKSMTDVWRAMIEESQK